MMGKYAAKVVGFVIAVTISMTIQCSNVIAAWGDFDTSFGFQGAVFEPDAGYRPGGVLVMADGKILISGTRTTPTARNLFLRRYLSNGGPDMSFGSGGEASGPSTAPWVPISKTNRSSFFRTARSPSPDGSTVFTRSGN